jgi:ectoine hydroxylase-related dioxygenase (phytanoyl-CoA dioxygenase family)
MRESQPTAAQIEAFRRDGAVVLSGLLDDRWLGVLERGLERNLRNPGRNFADFTSGSGGRCLKDYWAWRQIPEYQEFFRGSPVARTVGLLTGASTVRFLEDQFFVKEAGATTPSPWHQDAPYYAVEGNMCSTWMPLDTVSIDDALLTIAGSHAWNRSFRPISFSTGRTLPGADASTLEPIPDIDGAPPGQFTIQSWRMQPGDCLVFDSRTLHGNRGNKARHAIRRIALRWAIDTVKYEPGRYPWGELIEGHGLAPGQQLEGDTFPIVWTRQGEPARSA